MQGMGWCTMEELVWLKNGRMFTTGPGAYKVRQKKKKRFLFVLGSLNRSDSWVCGRSSRFSRFFGAKQSQHSCNSFQQRHRRASSVFGSCGADGPERRSVSRCFFCVFFILSLNRKTTKIFCSSRCWNERPLCSSQSGLGRETAHGLPRSDFPPVSVRRAL